MATIQGIKVNDPTPPAFRKANANFDALNTEVGAAATAVAAATAQLANITSGRYTPTLTEVEGFSTLTPASSHYMRIGDQVTVHFRADVDVDVGEDYVSLLVSLPIASNLANAADLTGPLTGDHSLNFITGWIEGDPTNNAALVTFFANDATMADIILTGSFQYEIKA